MNAFWFRTTSNEPRLRDPTQVLGIVGRYYFDFDLAVGVNRAADGQHHLAIHGDGWPGAWPLPAGTSPQAYEPDFATNGLEEFEAFLNEIAPFLAETLIVQAIGSVSGRFPLSACEWRIEPNSPTCLGPSSSPPFWEPLRKPRKHCPWPAPANFSLFSSPSNLRKDLS